jgi:GntR family transcriptional regulator
VGSHPAVPTQLRGHYDASDRPIQAAEDIYAGNQHEFAYEWNEGDIKP